MTPQTTRSPVEMLDILKSAINKLDATSTDDDDVNTELDKFENSIAEVIKVIESTPAPAVKQTPQVKQAVQAPDTFVKGDAKKGIYERRDIRKIKEMLKEAGTDATKLANLVKLIDKLESGYNHDQKRITFGKKVP